MKTHGEIVELKIAGQEYVLLPKADYLEMRGLPPGTVEATGYIRKSIGADLRAAREHAGLTQEELAKKLKKSQAMVSSAESGSMKVGVRYVEAVLKACKLPKDWRRGPKVGPAGGAYAKFVKA